MIYKVLPVLRRLSLLDALVEGGVTDGGASSSLTLTLILTSVHTILSTLRSFQALLLFSHTVLAVLVPRLGCLPISARALLVCA